MSCFHESSRWHNRPPGDSRTMKIPGAAAEKMPNLTSGWCREAKIGAATLTQEGKNPSAGEVQLGFPTEKQGWF